jgi:glycosyltransferase involved in cell wall biosynthesis
MFPKQMRNRSQFSNQGIAQEIPRVLNELGFAIDVIDYRNSSWRPKERYDLVVGHGGWACPKIFTELGGDPARVYLATGLYWREANVRVANRLLDVARQTGHLLPPERTTVAVEEEALRMCDGVVCIGNARTSRSFSAYRNVYAIENAAYPLSLKTHDRARDIKSFVFLAGRGNVHKGLDLVLTAAELMPWRVHVCQIVQNEFLRVYGSKIESNRNITLHGFVPTRSRKFQELAALSTWTILPTCAEGQPGSTIEAMTNGLLPILSDEANIDCDSFGILVERLTTEAVRDAMAYAASRTPKEIRTRQEGMHAALPARFSPEAFRESFKMAIRRILTAVRPGMVL